MKKLILSLTLLSCLSTNVRAEWVRVFDNVYTDTSYTKVNGQLVNIWFKNVFNTGSNVTLDQYNCSDKTYRFIRYTPFDVNGQPIYGQDVDWGYRYNDFKDVMPGSFVEKKFKVACGR